jgi:prophage regulatory protein
MARY